MMSSLLRCVFHRSENFSAAVMVQTCGPSSVVERLSEDWEHDVVLSCM